MIDDPTDRAADIVELLSFRLGDQEYCVDIMSVREIRGWTRATPLPHAPPFVRGVINLRGLVLPVIDLSARLGMEAIAGGEGNVIVVVQRHGVSAGLLVDSVSDILGIPAAALQPPPDLGGAITPGCIAALTVVDGALVRVLNLDAVLPGQPARAA